MVVVVLCSIAAGGSLLAVGAMVGWWFGSRRHKSDVVTSLCVMAQRAMNAALTNHDEQLARVLKEEETRIGDATEADKPNPFLSPAFRGGLTRREPPSVSMGKMP